MTIKPQEEPPILAADMPPETQSAKGTEIIVSRPPHSTTLPPLRVGSASTAPSTSSHVSTALDSPAALLSPAVLTRQKQCRPHAASVRRLILHRIGECLYRSETGIYYAILKVKGKQVRKSFKTTDKSIARKKLVEYSRQMCRSCKQLDHLSGNVY